MPLIARVGRNKLSVKFWLAFITSFLWLGVALHLFPVWWMFTSSIKPVPEVYKFPPTLWPHKPTLVCYKLFFQAIGVSYKGAYSTVLPFPVYVYFKNSLIYTLGAMAIQIPVCALVAYSLSKLHSPRWSRILFLAFITPLLIPAQIYLIPRVLLFKNFPYAFKISSNLPSVNLMNTTWVMILPFCYDAFNVLLFKGFFDTIPESLVNAARLDGASEIGILRRIIIPLSKPIFAVVSWFSFSGLWNRFLWPLTVLTEEKMWPISLRMNLLQTNLESEHLQTGMSELDLIRREIGLGWNLIMAMGIIQSIPIFIVFLICREYLMKGIRLRGFK